jgi:diguanylate cyclase (GGDEF)-like protein/PAS domain S-box-containing protein
MTTRATIAPLRTMPPALGQERIELAARLGVGVLVLAFGQLLPNLGSLFVVLLGIFVLGYALVIHRLSARAATPEDVEWVGRVTLAADVSIASFALLVFSPDPGWTASAGGFLVIASGGLRFRNGALLAAGSLSFTYLVIAAFRSSQLAMPLLSAQSALHLTSYAFAAAIFNRALPELDSMRRRELEVYEPVLQAQEESGEAFVVTEAARPVFWNGALQKMTGYDVAGLQRFTSLAELVMPDSVKPEQAFDEELEAAAAFDGHLYTREGRRLDVEVSRRPVRTVDAIRQVWILRDVTAHHRTESSLREQALHDSLTGLPNRALLEDRLRVALLKSHRQSNALSLLLLDLDGFKRVNDVFGHRAGDAVLVEVGKRLLAALRATDTVARLGGDEFVVVLPDTSLAGAELAAQSILNAIRAPVAFEEKHLEVGCSIGITMFPGHGDDAETLLQRADLAMYAAKREGGGAAVFNSTMSVVEPPR